MVNEHYGFNTLFKSILHAPSLKINFRRDGVGDLVEALRNPEKRIIEEQMEQEQKKRRVLNSCGQLIRNVDLPVCRIGWKFGLNNLLCGIRGMTVYAF